VARRTKGERARGDRAAVPAALRDAVQLRDGFTCLYCGRTGTLGDGVILTVDHVIPRYFGGVTRASNLVTACSPCNWMKGVYPLDLWLQRLGYGDAAILRAKVEAALAVRLSKSE
jgi:5-methylcytosine-specific restriction endonuclease McrA